LTDPEVLFYGVIGMFEENTDLSPDLEWMLQSGQVDDGTLIEALAQQFYQSTYEFALSWLTCPKRLTVQLKRHSSRLLYKQRITMGEPRSMIGW